MLIESPPASAKNEGNFKIKLLRMEENSGSSVKQQISAVEDFEVTTPMLNANYKRHDEQDFGELSANQTS